MSSDSSSATQGVLAPRAASVRTTGVAAVGGGSGGISPGGVVSGLLIASPSIETIETSLPAAFALPSSPASTWRRRRGFSCFAADLRLRRPRGHAPARLRLLVFAGLLLLLPPLEQAPVVVHAVVDAVEPAFEGGGDHHAQEAQ